MSFSFYNHNPEITPKKILDGSSSNKGCGHFRLEKSCFKQGTYAASCQRHPVLESQEINACLWNECKAEWHMSSLPQAQEAHPFHIICICSRKSCVFHQGYSASSRAHLAPTTAAAMADSYSTASLFTELLSRTTPKPARKPVWYGGKQPQQFSLVTLERAAEWYRGCQVSVNVDDVMNT